MIAKGKQTMNAISYLGRQNIGNVYHKVPQFYHVYFQGIEETVCRLLRRRTEDHEALIAM